MIVSLSSAAARGVLVAIALAAAAYLTYFSIRDARAHAAIRAGDHVFSTHDAGVADQSLRHELGMLHVVGDVGDNAGHE